jgi:hypothetical protein
MAEGEYMNLDQLLELYFLHLRGNYGNDRLIQILQNMIIAAYGIEFEDDSDLEEFEKVEQNSLKK